MGDQLVDFLERAGIEQPRHALAGRELALLMLFLEARFATTQFGETLAFSQAFDRIHRHGLLSVPTPSSLTIMRSPGTRGPTPDGVPVVMTSPGCRVMKRETCSTR